MYCVETLKVKWLLPAHKDRVPLGARSFVIFLSPVFICYYAMAVLALMDSTRLHRLGLLLPTLYALWVAGTNLDISNGMPEYNHNNYGYCIVIWALAMRVTEWALTLSPIARPRKYPGRSVWTDALDLCCTIRGINWTWSRGLVIPRETRPRYSQVAFVHSTFLRMLRDAFACDLVQVILQHMAPTTFGSLAGGTIFDATLPPIPRYLYSTLITLLAGLGIYSSLNMMYHFSTVLAFLLSVQDPADWPPLSDAPWRATSLADFWATRWHQLFRRSFMVLGYKPGHALLGRVGGVLAVFILSAVMHNVCIWGMARGSDFWQIGGFFILNGIGVVGEGVFQTVTGRKIGGIWGWAWTAVFVLSTANLVIDAWLIRGFVGSAVFPEPVRPTLVIMQVVRLIQNLA